ERILGLGLLERCDDEGEARTLGALAHQPGPPLLAPASAVIAPAVARSIEAAHRQADLTDRRAHVDAPLAGAEAAPTARGPQGRHSWRIVGVERHHAAGGIAEQRGEGSAQ